MWWVGRASKPRTAVIQSLNLEKLSSLSGVNVWLVHCIGSPPLLKYFSCCNFWQFLTILIQFFSLPPLPHYWLQSKSDAVPTMGIALDLQFNFHWGHQSALCNLPWKGTCTGALQQRYGWTWNSSVFLMVYMVSSCYVALLLACHFWCIIRPVQATWSSSALATSRYSLIPQIKCIEMTVATLEELSLYQLSLQTMAPIANAGIRCPMHLQPPSYV